MPPRSAKRKQKAKKKVASVETPVVESSTTIIDDSSKVSEELNKKDDEFAQSKIDPVLEENNDSVKEVEGGDEAVNVMKQEIQPEIVMPQNVNLNSDGVVLTQNCNDTNMHSIEEDKGENVAEKTQVVEKESIEGEVVSNGGSEPETVSVAEPNSHVSITAAQINNTEECANHNGNLDLLIEEGDNQKGEGEESGDGEGSEEDSKDDKDPIIEGMNENNIEIFVGGLDKKAVEDDLIEVFGKFGEIKTAKIVRKPNSWKSKGFAFIQYATLEQTKHALSELQDGIEVKGKHVRVSTSQDKDTLCVGNVCKTWTREHVLEKLKEYGVEDIVDIQLPDDQNGKEFVLLKFSNHTNAIEAHQRLSRPDAVFGCDSSAKVAFKHHVTPNEEALLQVKRVYIEGLIGDWNEEKLKDMCKQYGEITDVKLIQRLGKKAKVIGFVSFTSRESALACVEGIDNSSTGEGKVKVKAAIARPQKNSGLQQQIFSGGFAVKGNVRMNSKREGEKATSKAKGNLNSKRERRQGKSPVVVKENKKPKEAQRFTESQTGGNKLKVENRDRKRKNRTSNGETHHRNGREEHDYSKRPPKRARENMQGRQSNNFRDPRRDDRESYYRGHPQGAISASKRHSSDMEPHAGFLQPVGGKQQLDPYPRYVEPHAGYHVTSPPAGIQSQSYARGYHEPPATYASQGHPHVIYHHQREQPSSFWVQQAQTRSGYHEPGVVRRAHTHVAEHPQPSPVIRHDGQVRSGYMAAELALPPYVAKYSSYPVYEGEIGGGAGGYYQGSGAGAYAPRRAYYYQ